MTDDRNEDYSPRDKIAGEPAKSVSSEDEEKEARPEETLEAPPEKDDAKLSAGPEPVSGNEAESTAAGAEGDWFVDFDVWEAVLEANFGPDFETVLSRELGPDWVIKLNSRMSSVEGFYNMIEGIKKEIIGKSEEPAEQNLNNLEENEISFETLGPGEVIYDKNYTSDVPTKRYAGKRAPNLLDLTRKEFVEAREMEAKPPPLVDKVIDEKDEVIDDELVLMERSDFSKMSYYAHKELERHKDELKLKEVLKRKSDVEAPGRRSGMNRFLTAVFLGVFLYALFCISSYLACGYYSYKLLESLPPDLKFRPSTSLHKQGELSLTGKQSQKLEETPIILYFLLPSIKKMELSFLRTATIERYDLAQCKPSLLIIPRGPGGASVTVVRHYSESWPSNPGALLHNPLFSLSLDGKVALSAYETGMSSLLPGLTRLNIVDGQGASVAEAYVAQDLLNIRVEGLKKLPEAEFNRLTTSLVLLFSIIRL